MLFRLTLVTVLVLIVHNTMQTQYGMYDPIKKVLINDTDPEWVYVYSRYVVSITQRIYNPLLRYLLPIISVVTAFLTVSRDYGDGFYEVEKAGGVKPLKYFFGRISALVTVNSVALFIFGMLAFHLYTYTRGMVDGMTLNEYLIESNERIIRVMLCAGLPCVLFYVTLTYMLGCIFRSGIGSAVGSLLVIVAHYLCTIKLFSRMPANFDKYLPPIPACVEDYLYTYGEREFEEFIAHYGVTFNQAVAATVITLGCGVLFMAVSYICVRRRTK